MNRINQRHKAGWISSTIIGVTVMALSPLASAAGKWDVTLTPYLWAAGIDGDVDVGPVSADISADFDDIRDNLDAGGSLLIEANNGRWINWAAVDYLALENDDVDVRSVNAKVESDVLFLAVGTGYRFPTSGRSTLDVLVGLRYLAMDNKINVRDGRRAQNDRSVTDGIVTLRPRLAINEKWTFSPTISVGAGDSDLVWEASPQLLYTYSDRFDIRFGYRTLNYDFKKGSDEVDVAFAGFVIGAGIRF